MKRFEVLKALEAKDGDDRFVTRPNYRCIGRRARRSATLGFRVDISFSLSLVSDQCGMLLSRGRIEPENRARALLCMV